MLKLYFQRLVEWQIVFLKKIIVAAPEVPTISTVKRYFNLSPYLIIEQEGHGIHSFHFDGSGSKVAFRVWCFSVVLQEAVGIHNSLKFWKMDGLQAKFSLWGLGSLAAWVNEHPYLNRYHGKSFANFPLVSIFSLWFKRVIVFFPLAFCAKRTMTKCWGLVPVCPQPIYGKAH